MSGKAALASSTLKNVALTVSHPGEVMVPSPTAPKKTTVVTVETSSDRRPREGRTASRSCSRALGCQLSASLTGPSLQDGHVHGLAEPLLLDRVQGAVALDRRQALVHAVDQRVALLEEHAELLRGARLLLELAHDRGGRDLHGGDEERRGQVGHDRVDLVVEQGLLGDVGVLED